jgi:di/tricarboxylate transporter
LQTIAHGAGGRDTLMKIKWQTIAPLGIWLVIYLLPVPAGLNANQWHYFAVFAAVIAGLVLESMPVGAVGLIGLTFAGVMGYVESDPGKSLRWMLSGFSESTVWLIVGAFVFSIGYRTSGLGKRIAPLDDEVPALFVAEFAEAPEQGLIKPLVFVCDKSDPPNFVRLLSLCS